MIRASVLRLRSLRPSFYAVAAVALLTPAGSLAAPGPDEPSPRQVVDRSASRRERLANQYLDRFIGRWIGHGDSHGTVVSDLIVAERVLGDSFLLIQQREIGGAFFETDMYVGYDAADRRFELVFFSTTGSGANLAVRTLTGYLDGDKLVLNEKPAGVPDPRRYTFEFLDDDMFRLTKSIYSKDGEEPFIVEDFERERRQR